MQINYKNIRRIKFIFSIIIISLLHYHCAEEEKIVIFSESEVIRLLSGDSTKSWIRIAIKTNGQDQELTECDLRNVTKFYIGDLDSLKYSISKNPFDCEGDTLIINEGIWRIISAEDDIDMAEKIEFISKGDSLVKNINEITSLFLKLDWVENESLIEESFMVNLPE